MFLCVVSFVLGAIMVPSAQAAGTKYIRDNATGGDCASIASWNNLTKTCTLTADLPSTNLTISNNGITVDGAGHSLTGTGSSSGVRGVDLAGRSNVTIKNLNISAFSYGIYGNVGTNNVAVDNITTGNNQGIYFKNISGGEVSRNVANNIWKGIVLEGSSNIVINGNSASSNTFGIAILGTAGVMLNNTVNGNNVISNSDGIYLSNASGNTITNNTSTGSSRGINLASSASSNIISSNSLNGGTDGLVVNASSNGNSVLNNIISGNSGKGLNVNSSATNTFAYNTISGNGVGYGAALYATSNNLIYNNSFKNNGVQLYSVTGVGNLYNLPAPVGGNYFDSYDTPAEGCNDVNSDGFCDSPFVYGFVQDNLPWASEGAWCGKPALTLSSPQAFWGSYADYIARELSVNWTVRDNGMPAYDVKITSSVNNAGVTLLTGLPVSFGDIPAGGSSSQTLKYQTPNGVSRWYTIHNATAKDGCGTSYTYP